MSLFFPNQQEPILVFCDGEPVESIWLGEQVWPTNTVANFGVRVALPTPGTLDYLYWLHAVDAVTNGKVNDSSLFLKTTLHDEDYYLIKSPNGCKRLHIDGDVLELTTGVSEQLGIHAGDVLEVKAHIPQRYGDRFRLTYEPTWDSSRRASRWVMPLLPGTAFNARWHKGQKREDSYCNLLSVLSLPSDKISNIYTRGILGGKGRYSGGITSRKLTQDEIDVNDRFFELSFVIYGNGAGMLDGQGVCPVWPAFERTFSLNVISVF